MDIWTREFWAAAGTRAVRTAAQVAVASIGSNMVGITEINWLGVASISASAAVVSLLMAVARPEDLRELQPGGAR